MNFTDMKHNFTRIHEYKWFTPDKKYNYSVAFKEISYATDSRRNPFYPIRNKLNDEVFNKYLKLSKEEKDLLFIGRLAKYRYYDMHQVIGSSISKFKEMF